MSHSLTDKETFYLQLVDCLSHNNSLEFQRMLYTEDPKNLVDNFGMTLLHHAVIFDNVEMARYLIARGVDVNALNNCQLSALSFAIELKRWSIIGVLLAAEANIYRYNHCVRSPLQAILAADTPQDMDVIMTFLELVRKDNAGDSAATAEALLKAECPLPRAVLLRNPEITRHMLEAGCSINETDYDEDTALHYAVRAMDLAHVRLITDWGVAYDVVIAMNRKMQTPLHLYDVDADDDHQILRTLLNHGAPLAVRDHNGYMAVWRIFECGDREAVKMLLEYKVDLYATNRNGMTVLHHAADNENPGIMEQFRGRNFNVNARDVRGETALWYAVKIVNPESLRFLLENGADTRILDREGYTAFFQGFYVWVRMKDRVDKCLKCIELLLRYGVEIDCADFNGETIIDYALDFGNFVLLRPIIEYVAMGRAIGKPVTTSELFIAQIVSHEKLRCHLEFCRRKIDKMRRRVVFEKVTLFKFLAEDDRQLEMYTRNRQLVDNLRKIMHGMRRLNLYFVKVLRRRVNEAVRAARLREQAVSVFSKIEGLDENVHVVELILSFLGEEDLRNICLALGM